MESETQTNVQTSGIKTDSPGMIAPTTETSPSSEQVQEFLEPVKDFLARLPEEIGQFFSSYRQPLITLGIILLSLITVKITLAIIDAINDIPLLAPLFELVGLGYTGWFVYRYLLKESTRQELATELESLKTQVMGKNQ